MPTSDSGPPRPEKKLLDALSAKCYSRLVPEPDLVEMPLAKILYIPKEPIHHVDFPRWSAISMVNVFENGSMVEVGVVGRERNDRHFAIVRRSYECLRIVQKEYNRLLRGYKPSKDSKG